MTTLLTEKHDRKKYVKPNMFFMRWLAEKRKKKPLSSVSTTYKNQRDELARLSKLNPPQRRKEKRREMRRPNPLLGVRRK